MFKRSFSNLLRSRMSRVFLILLRECSMQFSVVTRCVPECLIVFGAILTPEVRAVGPRPMDRTVGSHDRVVGSVMHRPCILTILFGPQGMLEGAFDGAAAAPDPKRFKGNYFDPSGGPPFRVPSDNPPPPGVWMVEPRCQIQGHGSFFLALWHCFHGPHNRISGQFGRGELPVPPLSHPHRPPPLPQPRPTARGPSPRRRTRSPWTASSPRRSPRSAPSTP